MVKNGKTGRWYSPDEKAVAVRMAKTLRAELGADRETAHRVALQLGYGIELVRSSVRQADIDEGLIGGATSDGQAEIRRLEQETRALKRANEILKRAVSFFGAEPGRQQCRLRKKYIQKRMGFVFIKFRGCPVGRRKICSWGLFQ